MDILICTQFSMLNFDSLTQVYKETIEYESRNNYPDFSCFEQQMEGSQEFYNYLRNVFFQTENAVYFVLREKEEYLCAARIEPYLDGMLLEAVETDPRFRKKGYAKSLLSAITQYVRQMDLPLYAHVYKDNLASVSLHQSCGFVIVKEHAVFIDGSVSHSAKTFCYNKHPEN